MTSKEAEKHLDSIVARLAEHFDAVQILVSWGAEGGDTCGLSRGGGNWYARQGLAHEFIEQARARGNAHELSAVLDGGDDEDWKE